MGWHCKNTGYYFGNNPVQYYPDPDGLENCDQIYYILKNSGWTTNAICGLLTCIGLESGYNPWKWEGESPGGYYILPTQYAANHDDGSHNGYYGYGLVQWTPASYENVYAPGRNKYQCNPNAVNIPGYGPNFQQEPGSAYDGYAQIVFLDQHGDDGNDYYNSGGYYGNLAPDYADFKVSTAAASDLCETWVANFERPQNPSDRRPQRQALAAAFYNNYNGKPVLPPDLPPAARGIPVWLLLKWRQANMKKGRWY